MNDDGTEDEVDCGVCLDNMTEAVQQVTEMEINQAEEQYELDEAWTAKCLEEKDWRPSISLEGARISGRSGVSSSRTPSCRNMPLLPASVIDSVRHGVPWSKALLRTSTRKHRKS